VKPSFWNREVAATFRDPGVAASYRHRPPYPPETMTILERLLGGKRGAVLDLGCGTGLVARSLAQVVDRVDALDISAAMIAAGKGLPGGSDPRITWITGPAEDALLRPPYDLITAGDSLHWMDWEIVLPRLAGVLSPAGYLAVLSVGGYLDPADEGARQGLVNLIKRYSTFTEWRPGFDLIGELERRELFHVQGRAETAPVPFRQPIADYVESFHARASLSWQRMTPADAAAFDRELTNLLRERSGEAVELSIRATVVWGKPIGR